MADDPRRTIRRVRGLVDAATVEGHEEGFLRLCDLCDAAASAVDTGTATVSVLTDVGPMLVASNGSAVGPALTDLQTATGEGPSIEACARHRPVLVRDLLESRTRWPGLVLGLDRADVRAVFAIPLEVGAATLGVLEMSRPAPLPLDGEQTRTALAFAEVATEVLLDIQAGRERASGVGDAPWAVGLRAEVYQAQGMVMVDLDVGLTEAMLRMQGHALAHGTDLNHLASQILAGTVRLDAH